MNNLEDLIKRRQELIDRKEAIDAANRVARESGKGTRHYERAESARLQILIARLNGQIKREEALAAPLKPCPFCGSESVLTFRQLKDRFADQPDQYIKLWFVICPNPHCRCALHPSKWGHGAVDKWNKRAN